MERLSTGYADQLLADFATTYRNGVLAIYSGTQPASADAAETGTLLCLITNGGGAFTAGSPTNGLNFGTPSGGVVDKAAGETWKGKVLVDGTPGWFRFYDNSYTTGASTTARRFDGAISNAATDELQLSNVTFVVADTELTIEELPVSYPLD